MVKGLYTAHTGMINQMNRLDVITNNLANSATNGYKKEGATAQSFDDELTFRIKDSSSYNLDTRIGTMTLGVKIGETYTDYSQGSFKETGNQTDLALAGNGFFAISFTNRDGETSIKYTRDGAFTVDQEGYLRTKDGDYVLNAYGAENSDGGVANYVRVNPNMPFVINAEGQIVQDNEVIGDVGVVDFANYDYIEKYGENMYNLIEGGTLIEADAQINQGYLEMSNVNVVKEMVEMITITRAYESNQKLIQTIDSTLEKTVNQIGKI